MDVYVCVLLESFWGRDLTSGNYTDYKALRLTQQHKYE